MNEEYKKLESNTHQRNKNFAKNLVICTLAFLLLLTVGYIVFDKETNSTKFSEMQLDINNLERSREVLKQELRITRAQYEESKNAQFAKDSSIHYRDRLIFEKQKAIQSILNREEIDKGKVLEAKNLILSLRGDIEEYKLEITKLRKENRELHQKNTVLVKENEIISDKKKEVENNLSQEKTEHENLVKSTNATLSISNYTIKGLKVKSSGKEVETDRAKRINKVRVAFEIDKNAKALSEDKELYVTVYKPDGKIGLFEGAESGTMKLRSGLDIQYSDKVKVSYNSESGSEVSFDWTDYDFPKGDYKIDIYQNGFKIGQNIISLK